MSHRLSTYFATMIVACLCWAGCSTTKMYGKLTPNLQAGDDMTIEALEEFWEDYTVYYTGCCGGFPINHPSAVMFDPRGDDKELVVELWDRVETKYRLNKLVSQIKDAPQVPGYTTALRRITSSNGDFYGYMYTAWASANMKQIDNNTMFVLNLPAPPYLDRRFPGTGHP